MPSDMSPRTFALAIVVFGFIICAGPSVPSSFRMLRECWKMIWCPLAELFDGEEYTPPSSKPSWLKQAFFFCVAVLAAFAGFSDEEPELN